MIPIKLSFQGLYSYQKEQSIDFTTLTSNHIFGIFGSVGSGKSSILEAITFALYGQTERFNLSGDSRNYNMMNLKSNVLRIEFDFIAGADDLEYKIVCEGKRNSNNYDEVKKINRNAYLKKADQFVPVAIEEVESVVGLSYDNFKRTVIIPQGKFQDFLQLKNADRTRMMKELFNLDKYELYNQAKSLLSKNLAELQTLNGRIEQIGSVSKEDFEILNKHTEELKKQISGLNKEISSYESILKEQEKLKELQSKLNNLHANKKSLDEKKDKIIQIEKELNEFEYCSLNFKNILDNLIKHQENKESINTDIAKGQNNLRILKESQEKLNEEFQLINEKFENLDKTAQEKDDIKKLIEININKQNIEKNKDRIKNGQIAIEKNSTLIRNLETAENKTLANIDELKKKIPDIEILTKAQSWHHQHKQLIETQKELEKNISTKKEKLDFSKSELIQKHSEKKFRSILLQKEDGWIKSIEEEKNKLKDELKRLDTEINDINVQLKLEEFAINLKEGVACPLCGSEHHPNTFNIEDITHITNKINLQRKKLEEDQFETDQLLLQIQHYINYKNLQEQDIKELENKQSNIIEKLNIHVLSLVKLYPTMESTTIAINELKELQVSIKNEEEKVLSIKKDLTKEQADREKFIAGLTKIEKETDNFKNTVEVLINQINIGVITNYENYTNEELLKIKENIELEISTTRSKYQHLKQQIEETNKKIEHLQGILNANEKFLLDIDKNIQSNSELLNNKLKLSKFDTIMDVKNILKKEFDIITIREEINQFHKEFHNINENINEIKIQLGNKTYEEDTHKEHILKHKTLVDSLEKLIREEAEINSRLKDLKEKLASLNLLEKQKKELEIRKDDINTLVKLFVGSGFVNYISSVYLRNLCNNANQRFFKMTKQKLSLELNKDNTFEVRDYLNGGKIRSIKTLSGGQTFQASLALALALSDNIQNMAKTKQNFFFLDEGFGSLDKESLHIVFSTLKNLRKENRIVGIISHVEELQQEIPTYLQITQDENAGSTIKESWN